MSIDYIVLVAYLVGVCVVGLVATTKVRGSEDLFAAGRQASWWVSGLSAYMTMFSAATFVVWGGVAYRLGLVAIVINLTYGVAALLVGAFVASRWQRTGVLTAAEFIELRFGRAALIVFTLLNLVAKMVSVSVGLYALAVMICALIPTSPENWLGDPATGHFSLAWMVLALGAMVIAFTAAGGLWAVLVTDVVQFVIIMIAVSLMAPLIIYRVGGFGAFIDGAPEGFFLPARGEWSWLIITGWCTLQFVMIGAEWAFVQRFLCVNSERSARRVAWLFGALYLVTPLLWMAPPMIYRTINPDADPEQAYILACQSVLPPGALGLMLAAMAAATLSGVDSQLNVFAGVLTNDLYKPLLRPTAGDAEMLRVGRILTVALGGVLIALALLAPYWGGAEALVVKVTSLYVGPLLLPTIWGLFSRRLTSAGMWATVVTSAVAATAVAAISASPERFAWGETMRQVVDWLRTYPRHADMLVGVVTPLIVLTTLELVARSESVGWLRVERRRLATGAGTSIGPQSAEGDGFTFRAAGWTLIGSGGLLGGMAGLQSSDALILLTLAAVLLVLGVVCVVAANRLARRPTLAVAEPIAAE